MPPHSVWVASAPRPFAPLPFAMYNFTSFFERTHPGRYLACRCLPICIDPRRRSTALVHSTRGVVGMVRFGGQPAVVPDAVKEALWQCEDPASGLYQAMRPPLSAGEPVKLVDGPLAGVEGVFTPQDGERRVIVLLELPGKVNKVTVDRAG